MATRSNNGISTVLGLLALALAACESGSSARKPRNPDQAIDGHRIGDVGNADSDGTARNDSTASNDGPGTHAAVKAFPGAEGFGAGTRGAYALYEKTKSPGDLPQIIPVTNLNSSGTGSLRAALLTTGPRLIVFRVAGVIELADKIEILACGFDDNRYDYLTVAGQTAPGGGITIKGSQINTRCVSEQIWRGIRFRTGDGAVGSPINQRNNLSIWGDHYDARKPARNIVIDRNSFSWSADKLLTLYFGVEYASVTNNILSEPLLSVPGGPSNHNYAMTIGPGVAYLTIARNIISSSQFRNPLLGGGIGDAPAIRGSLAPDDPDGHGCYQGPNYVEVVNNVSYNAGWGSFALDDNSYCTGGVRPQFIVNIGNYKKNGPSYANNFQYIVADPSDGLDLYVHNDSRVYLYDNKTPLRTSDAQAQDAVFGGRAGLMPAAGVLVDYWPFETSGVTISDVDDNFSYLINTSDGMTGDIPNAGAYPRDPVDALVIQEIQSGTAFVGTAGTWPRSVTTSSYGGYPTYAGAMWADSDSDGMDDAWEIATFGDLSQGPHGDYDENGYSNVEDYVNGFFGSIE